MPNITYISCSVWLFCNTIAIHLLKKKNSCDHLSLNTCKSLLRTGSMSRPKNIYTCINKKYFATNYVSCSINSFILVHITFNKTIAQVPIKWYTACPRLFYVHQAWLKMKHIFYNTSYIFIYIYIYILNEFGYHTVFNNILTVLFDTFTNNVSFLYLFLFLI